MYHFFVEPFQIHEEQEYIEILGGDVNHIENVLRMKQGEELTISDGLVLNTGAVRRSFCQRQ